MKYFDDLGMMENREIIQDVKRVIAHTGSYDTMMYFVERYKMMENREFLQDVKRIIANTGSYDTMMYFVERYKMTDEEINKPAHNWVNETRSFGCDIIVGKNLKLMKWFVEKTKKTVAEMVREDDFQLMKIAIFVGSTEILEWLVEEGKVTKKDVFDNEMIFFMNMPHQEESLQWIVERFGIMDGDLTDEMIMKVANKMGYQADRDAIFEQKEKLRRMFERQKKGCKE
jgi:hypothetical protein